MNIEKTNESTNPYAGMVKNVREHKSPSAIDFESRKPTIRITRLIVRSKFRRWLRLFSIYEAVIAANEFAVLLNDEHLHDLRPGDSVLLEVATGLNKITVRTPIAKSTKKVELESGDRVLYDCCPTMTGIILTRKL